MENSKRKKTIAITGANGMIGRYLVKSFLEEGWRVKALQRKADSPWHENLEYFHFELPDKFSNNILEDVDVLIHAAVQYYDARHKNSDFINIKGTKRLLQISREHHIKFIFLSSLSAHAEAISHYGKHKWQLEKIFDLKKDLVLRLGLVIGQGGLFTSIFDLVENSKVIPLVEGGEQPIQIIFIDDLIRIIKKAVLEDLIGSYNVAENKVHTIKELHQLISKQLGKNRFYVSIPFWAIWWGVSIAEKLGIQLSVSTENLLGLKCMRAFETEHDLNRLGVQIKTMEEAVTAMFNNSPA